ncbi:MAG: redoxin domain-containing protein [Treponema sp.]|jgi:cytochrome c-type biogenesis protein|nr:redoxin domain-containing protein [Treponema sp.]
MLQQASVLLAFGAGLLSFVSPCVLPLIPSYLAFLGGVGLDRGDGSVPGAANRPRLAAATASFILGFSAIFIVLSLLFSGTFFLLGGAARYINLAAGIIVIILGLNVIFDFLKFLNYEKRARIAGRSGGLPQAFLMGLAFGAGWSPCVGPFLGSILLMAGQAGNTGRAVLCLSAYSAGLGLPFLAAGVFFDRFLKGAAKLRPRLPLIRRIGGIFLAGIGIFTILGRPGLTVPGRVPAAERDELSAPLKTDPEVKRILEDLGIPAADPPIPMFDFSAEAPDGTVIRLSDLKGKALFLNFWATWCGPCRMEMPSMEALYRRFKDRGLEILAVNVRENRRDVAAFMEEMSLSFPAALDLRGDIASDYGIEAFPTTYLIDRNGGIVARLVGAIHWDVPELEGLFEALTKAPAGR